ncbi:MAG: CHAP domain-containing protein [bacterium]|nr:CHAP domain-containing protein [bacterium]
MPVYQDEERDYSPEALKAREKARRNLADEGAEPLSPSEQASLDQIQAGLQDDGTHVDGSIPNSDNSDAEQEPGLFRSESPKKRGLRGRIFNKKTGIGAGILGLTAAGGIGLFSILSGPMQAVQFAEMLQKFHFGSQEEFNDGRVTHIFRYMKGTRYKNNLGLLGNKMADRYEAKLRAAGLNPDYDGRNNIQAFTLDPSTTAGKKALDNMKFRGVNVDAFEQVGNGKLRVTLRGFGSTGEARQILRASVDSMNFSKITSYHSKRLMIKRANVTYHLFANRARETGESLVDYNKRVNDEADKYIRNGVQESDLTRQRTGEDAPEDGSQADQDNATAADRVAQDFNDMVDTEGIPSGEEGIRVVSNRMRTNFTRGVGIAGIATLMCSVKEFGDSFGPYMYSNVILPLMRLGAISFSAGSQIKAIFLGSQQDVNLDELGTYTSNFYDEASKTSAFGAASIQAEQGQEVTGSDMPSVMKPGREKPEFFGYVDSIPAIDPFCDAAGSTLGQIGLSIGGAIASGGPLAIFTDFFTDQAISVAADRFNIFENLARLVFGGGVSNGLAGELRGNAANYGTRLIANDSFLAMGAKELSGTEEIQVDAAAKTEQILLFRQKPLLARLADPYDSQSLLSSAVIQKPFFASMSSSMTSLATLPGNMMSLFGSGVTKLMPSAHAQATYDYGFAQTGFTQSEQEDPRFEIPAENAQYVVDHYSDMTKYEPCFGSKVDPISGVLTAGISVRMDERAEEEACQEDTENMKRYRFYLADTINAKAMACHEKIDEAACIELGHGAGGSSSTPTGPINCTSVTGNEKIVCAAQNYPDIRYSNGHSKWSGTWGVGNTDNRLNGGADAEAFLSSNNNNPQTLVDTAFIDCSGYTNLALFSAFGYKTTAGCSGMYVTGADPNIVEIPIAEARPGDFLTISRGCDGAISGHIGILVSKNADGTFTTLESSAGENTKGEIKSGFYSKELSKLGGNGEYDFKYAARYTGPGSSP